MFDRDAYERAIKQIDEAPTVEDYYAALCSLAEAQGRGVDPRHRARAGGLALPPPAPSLSERSRFSSPERSRSHSGWGTRGLAAAPGIREARGDQEELEIPRLRPASKPVSVAFTMSTWEELCAFARASRDGREAGGFLLGPYLWSWHERVSVSRVVSGAFRRGVDSAHLDIAKIVAEKASISRNGADGHFGEVGCWHTHPGGSGEPSERDLATWLNARDFIDHGPYLGLILTPGSPRYGRWNEPEPNWSSPTVHAWIVRRNDVGRSVYERALVETNGRRS